MSGLVDRVQDKPTFYARWSWAILASTILIVPYSFYHAGKAVQSNVNKIEDWLPKGFRETGELKWFRDNFPTDQFIMITWEGCKLAGDPEEFPDEVDDPRIQQLADYLNAKDAAAGDIDAEECRKFIKGVKTSREYLDQLTSPPQSLSHAEAVERLKGSVLGPDGRQACLLVTPFPEATMKLKPLLGRGQYRIFRPSIPPGIIRRQVAKCNITPDNVRFGGPPVDNISIDEEGEKTLVRLAGVSGLLGLFLAYWSLRSIGLTLVVFFCGVLSAAFSLAMISLTGETVDAIVMSMPALVYVLAISGSVHLINYYKDAVIEGGVRGATERAVIHAIKPAALCTTTTALGLISLYASELNPIRKFGIYSAIGVILLTAINFLFLPAALQVFRFSRRWENADAPEGEEMDADTLLDVTRMNPLGRFWNWLGSSIIRQHGLVFSCCILFIALIGAGLTKAKTSINLLELFDPHARILEDYRWIENNLGMLVPLEVVIRFSPESQAEPGSSNAAKEDIFKLTFLERIETTKLIQETISNRFGEAGQGIVGRSMSAATFAPSMPPTTSTISSWVQRKTYNTRFEKSRPEFLQSGFLRMDPKDGSELWRISLRVAAFKGVDYGQFVHELRDVIEPLLRAHEHRVEILTELAKLPEDEKPKPKQVLLWDTKEPVKTDNALVNTQQAAVWEEHESYVNALHNLLTKAGVKVKRGHPDPDKTPIITMQSYNADGIALVGMFSDQQVANIAAAIPKAIDLNGVPNKKDVDPKERWMSAVYTGVVPIVYKAQRELLQSLVSSTFWSFVTITPLMMFVSRSIRAGMVAMLPNVLPIFVIFGAMGWMDIAIDIGSMMTASIALGVAVDDTIHFLSWFRGDLDKLKDRNKAILVAYQRCATPTLQAALISGLGLSVFAFSTFTPTQRFGWLMLTILVAGVFAELIMLPAILAGPLGKVFERSTKRNPFSRWWLIARYQARRMSDSKPSEEASRAA